VTLVALRIRSNNGRHGDVHGVLKYLIRTYHAKYFDVNSLYI
jgi:hypothetical protein